MNPELNSGLRAGDRAIDMDVIQGLRELGGEDEPELLAELIQIFLQDAPQRIQDITEGLAHDDLARIERGAHTLKSSSANIGAMGLSELCRRIVECARTSRPQELPVLCDASVRALETAVAELREIEG